MDKANPRKSFYTSSGPKSSPILKSDNSNQNAPKSKPPGENKGYNPLSQPNQVILFLFVLFLKQNGKS